jgi:hypothetical protein
MERSELKLESLKMIREWSTWLAGLQAAICALLWSPLKESVKKPLPSLAPMTPSLPPETMATDLVVLLHLGWFAFLFSLLLTALLLARLPRMAESLEQNEESIFQAYLAPKISLSTMLSTIYALFFLGLILTGIFVLLRAAR